MMNTEVLKLNGVTTEAGAEVVMRTLKEIAGVNDVNVSVAGARATVHFDHDLTSLQELQTVLARAGYALDTTKSEQVKKSGCCGGCGG